ncbi:MAG TPA: class I SAM-dependent methyltransferase [Rhodospirillaceae bacterium]|nr:2-polyprenyl-3-methyl-5-hydroxy-6-metoxy-1,4-benzoquinol methylase [Rhodospirillaceae bacterium]HAA92540.1 class I SAM-dependent methyltransferase [Rhodospirillaceae bacterium]HAT36740.1 class I SAM-dependent methyltransferase [Rhodospirillaceae bacterium]
MYPDQEISKIPEKSATATAAALLPLSGAVVLDVGCGMGALTCFLAECGAEASGIDPNEARIATAREQARDEELEVTFYEGVGEALPFEDGEFDIVIFSNSLHHVPTDQIPTALAEAHRVLCEEGLLYVMEPVPGGSYFDVGRPINDETDIRTNAYEQVKALGGNGFIELKEVFSSTPRRYRDFSDFRQKYLARNSHRADLFAGQAGEMEKLFDQLATPATGGFVLDGAIRVNLLQKDI